MVKNTGSAFEDPSWAAEIHEQLTTVRQPSYRRSIPQAFRAAGTHSCTQTIQIHFILKEEEVDLDQGKGEERQRGEEGRGGAAVGSSGRRGQRCECWEVTLRQAFSKHCPGEGPEAAGR